MNERMGSRLTLPFIPPPPPRFFMGKNKVMQKALGTRPEDEFRDNLRFVSKVKDPPTHPSTPS